MLELYIIRHGIAGKSLEDEKKDEKRPLNKKGKEKMADISKGLKARKISFGTILSSPLLRAKESAEIIHHYCGGKKKVLFTDLLRPEVSYDKLIQYLNTLKDKKKVALVGHEPFLSEFASYCLAKSKNSMINLKKGGVLKLEYDEVIKPGHCMLSWLMEPHQLILD